MPELILKKVSIVKIYEYEFNQYVVPRLKWILSQVVSTSLFLISLYLIFININRDKKEMRKLIKRSWIYFNLHEYARTNFNSKHMLKAGFKISFHNLLWKLGMEYWSW